MTGDVRKIRQIVMMNGTTVNVFMNESEFRHAEEYINMRILAIKAFYSLNPQLLSKDADCSIQSKQLEPHVQ